MPSILVAFLTLVGIILIGSALWAILAPARGRLPGRSGAVVDVMMLTAFLYVPILVLALTQGLPVEADQAPCLVMAALAAVTVDGSRRIA